MPRAYPATEPLVGAEHNLANVVSDGEGLENSQPEWPPSFCCPITQEPMHDPVIAMDGMSYEYSVIREWFREHSTSPVTNLQLRSKLLIRNTALRNAMQEWNELATLPDMPRGEAGAMATPPELGGDVANVTNSSGGTGSGGEVGGAGRAVIAFESPEEWNTLASNRRSTTTCVRDATQWCAVRPWFFTVLGLFAVSAGLTLMNNPFPPMGAPPGPDPTPPDPQPPIPPGPGGPCPPFDPNPGPPGSGGAPPDFWERPSKEHSLQSQVFKSWADSSPALLDGGKLGDFDLRHVELVSPLPVIPGPPNGTNASTIKYHHVEWRETDSRLTMCRTVTPDDYLSPSRDRCQDYGLRVTVVPCKPKSCKHKGGGPDREAVRYY